MRQDWPRLPLSTTREALKASPQRGRQVAALLDTEQSVPSVILETKCPELKRLGLI